jgi:hypothetical protein
LEHKRWKEYNALIHDVAVYFISWNKMSPPSPGDITFLSCTLTPSFTGIPASKKTSMSSAKSAYFRTVFFGLLSFARASLTGMLHIDRMNPPAPLALMNLRRALTALPTAVTRDVGCETEILGDIEPRINFSFGLDDSLGDLNHLVHLEPLDTAEGGDGIQAGPAPEPQVNIVAQAPEGGDGVQAGPAPEADANIVAEEPEGGDGVEAGPAPEADANIVAEEPEGGDGVEAGPASEPEVIVDKSVADLQMVASALGFTSNHSSDSYSDESDPDSPSSASSATSATSVLRANDVD